MFLINSRTPFDIETCYLHSRHPLYQRYRARLPNSLKSIPPIRLGFLSQGHLSRFWVRFSTIKKELLFHGLQASSKHCCHSIIILFLIITTLQRIINVRPHDGVASTSPKRQKFFYRCRLCRMYANMNAFPIPVVSS